MERPIAEPTRKYQHRKIFFFNAQTVENFVYFSFFPTASTFNFNKSTQMSFSDFTKVDSLTQLNTLLTEKSYVAGYVLSFNLQRLLRGMFHPELVELK
jgi:hypothetical protein